MNKAAFTPAAAGYFGTLSRGTIVGPGFTNLDASLHKVFNMPYNEKHQLSIRFEAFNALNHPNWNNPTLSYSSSTFGRITNTTGAGNNSACASCNWRRSTSSKAQRT